jgi:hypothetical protein
MYRVDEANDPTGSDEYEIDQGPCVSSARPRDQPASFAVRTSSGSPTRLGTMRVQNTLTIVDGRLSS